jgi:hypothetical protein
VAIAPSTPYDSAESILQLARSISADAATANGLAGDILADSQPYIFPLLTKAYRDLQDELISQSSEIMNKYGYVYALEPTAYNNPRFNVQLSFLGYTYGEGKLDGTKALPPDMVKPLELWECIAGQQRWVEMKQASDSISSRPTNSRFRIWDFQNDILYMPGASQTNDLKIKYLGTFPDLAGPTAPVYILRSQTYLANKLVADVGRALGALEMIPSFEAEAEKAKARIVNRTARKESYGSYNRRPFRQRGSRRGRY